MTFLTCYCLPITTSCNHLKRLPIKHGVLLHEVLASCSNLVHFGVVFHIGSNYNALRYSGTLFGQELKRLVAVNQIQRLRSLTVLNVSGEEVGFPNFLRGIAEPGCLEHLLVDKGWWGSIRDLQLQNKVRLNFLVVMYLPSSSIDCVKAAPICMSSDQDAIVHEQFIRDLLQLDIP